ncbi:hypothetical protein L7F22_057781 [Adiantum nelumboides]|nr:hypothetical protein [Adiantum nelumboides]
MSGAVANQASGPFWRAAGMTYVAYVNTCSSIVRKCLKEPHKAQAATREQVYYKVALWEDGLPVKSGHIFLPQVYVNRHFLRSESGHFSGLCERETFYKSNKSDQASD